MRYCQARPFATLNATRASLELNEFTKTTRESEGSNSCGQDFSCFYLQLCLKRLFFFIFSVILVYCIQNGLKPTVGQQFADDNS